MDSLKLLAVLMLVFGLGFAQDVTVVLRPNTARLEQGEGFTFAMLVTNRGTDTLEMRVGITGNPTWMRVTPSRFTLQPGATRELELKFSNRADPGSYIYLIELLSGNETVAEGNVMVNVEGSQPAPPAPGEPRYVYIDTQEAANPGDTLIINLQIPRWLLPSDVEIRLLKGERGVVEVSNSMDQAQKSFTLRVPESQEAGDYQIRAYLPGKGVSNETSVRILQSPKVKVEKNVERRLLGREVNFIVDNIGNVPRNGVVTTDITILDRPLLEASPPPQIIKDGWIYTLSWGYAVAPGQELKVASYTIDYVPYSIIGVLLAIAIVLIFQKPEPVEVRKEMEQVHEGDEARIKVRLAVTNNSDEPVENVVVKDLMPRIATITKVFIVKPDVERTREGTQLKWELGKFNPGEERILAYEAKLSFGIIGELKLPKPSISWSR